MNIKQQTFVEEKMGGKTNGAAYAKAYDRPNDDYARKAGHRLTTNDDVSKTLEEIERDMPLRAAEAFTSYVNLAKDPKTPANVKEKIYAKVMALAGILEKQIIESKTEVVYKGLNDDTSWIEQTLKDIKQRKEA